MPGQKAWITDWEEPRGPPSDQPPLSTRCGNRPVAGSADRTMASARQVRTATSHSGWSSSTAASAKALAATTVSQG